MTKPDWAERIQRSRAIKYAQGQRDEQQRIIALLETEIRTWQRTPSFNYRVALIGLIERIKNV